MPLLWLQNESTLISDLFGCKVVLDRTIKKCDWAESFESVFEGLGSDFNSETLSKVLISSNERIVEPAHIVPLDAPIKLLDTYNCHYICDIF